jgi:serine/threonine-protein kinase
MQRCAGGVLSYVTSLALPAPVRELAAPTVSPYKNGDLIAFKYELQELLGRGSMGEVWRAQNVALGASVAIKILCATSERAALSERLRLEAKVAASVTHPAIVKVFDVGETARADPFIVMELLNGTSLGAMLRAESHLSAVRAVQILLPIAEALQLAHSRGLVHRDVKPDNIFIVHDEGSVQPKLVDFGIVKVQKADGHSHLTRAGDVLGSPDYLSPEQARGQDDVDHLSDVWAFSVVLFEAIAGRVPFDAPNYNALVQQIIEDEPPGLRELAAVDERLSAIVARGLRKERSQRYGSMVEMGRALAGWLHAQGELQDACGTSIERRWLRASITDDAFGISSAWHTEAGSGLRAYDCSAATVWPAAEARPSAAPPATVATKRLGARVAAVALIIAVGFALVAWHQVASQERATAANIAAAKRAAAREPQPVPGPASALARDVLSPVAAPLPENFATAEVEAASPSVAPRQQRAAPPRPALETPAVTGTPAAPHTKGDLIKPY